MVGDGLENKLLTMEVRNQPIEDVLALLARRMDVTMRREGNLYFIGALKPEDKGILVRRVRRAKVEQLQQALSVFAGEHGKSAQFTDGLVVVGDTVEVLKRVSEMLDLVEASDAPVWIVQLHLVSYSRAAADELGINVEPAAKAGLAFASGSLAGAVQSGLSLSASLDTVLQVAFSRDDVSVTAAPMFLLCDGTKAEFVQGDRLPIPKRSVSNEGTVQTVGYEYVQTGVQVELLLREFTTDSARIELLVNMSDLKRMVEEAPVTGEEKFKTDAIVRAGGVYLLGTLVKDRKQGRQELGFQSGDYVLQSAQVVQVWGQCYRIAGALPDAASSVAGGMQVVAPGPVAPAPGIREEPARANNGGRDLAENGDGGVVEVKPLTARPDDRPINVGPSTPSQ